MQFIKLCTYKKQKNINRDACFCKKVSRSTNMKGVANEQTQIQTSHII